MKKILSIALLASGILFVNCGKEATKFKITKEAIGLLTKDSKVADLETIYAEDSIVAVNGVPEISLGLEVNSKDAITENTIDTNLTYSKIEIFEKGGVHLLSLTPSNDTIAKIENIRIYDPRYTTEKGLSINSTFKDVKDNYTIKKIITSMNNVVIILKETSVYLTIDKKELPESLRYDSSINIEAVQIPDAAKIKYMMFAWD